MFTSQPPRGCRLMFRLIASFPSAIARTGERSAGARVGGLVPAVSGFGLYYPRRRQQPAALAALVETLDSTLAARDPAAGRRRS